MVSVSVSAGAMCPIPYYSCHCGVGRNRALWRTKPAMTKVFENNASLVIAVLVRNRHDKKWLHSQPFFTNHLH